jgi:hypothetical protein
MQASKLEIRTWALVPLLVGAIAAVWLAADGRLHWDEPSFLYAGAYLDTADIIAGDVQPSGIPGFTQGRILHALLVKGVMALSTSTRTGFWVLIALDLALVVFSLVLISRIVRALLPGVIERRAATVLAAMTPVVLYMSFKTFGDNEAWTAGVIATYALLRGGQGGDARWIAVAAMALAVAALTKNHMAFMPAAFWTAMCVVPIGGIERKRLAIMGAISGAGGILLTLAMLEWLGLGLNGYLISFTHPFESTVPLVAKFVNLGTELGLLWLLVPVSLLSSRRRELLALGLWFVLLMAPFVFVFKSIEPRHVVGNLAAVGALFALALEAIDERFNVWRRLSDGHKSAIAVVAVLMLMGGNALMLAIMPHRVDIVQMRAMLGALDERYGAGRYALLTARGYTDFHLIRVLWPERDVRDVGTDAMAVRTGRRPREEVLRDYLGTRYHQSLAELAAIDRPLIFMGYRQTFAAENLRLILSHVSPRLADRLLGSVSLVEQLYAPPTQWIWGSPEVRMEPVMQIGHYVAFKVSIMSNTGRSSGSGLSVNPPQL